MRLLFLRLLIVFVVFYSLLTSSEAQTPEEYYDRGISKYNIGEYESAISDFHKAIELNINKALKAEAYANIGTIYNQSSNWKEALSNCNKALSIDTININAYECRANANLALGNKQDALQDFNQVIILDPRNIHAYVGRGTIYKAIGNYQQAIKDFDAAILIAPNGSVNADIMLAYASRGISKLKLGEESAGCQDLTKAWQLGYLKAYEFVQKFCPKN